MEVLVLLKKIKILNEYPQEWRNIKKYSSISFKISLLKKKYTKGKRTKEISFYTNEHPDFFRLDIMKLNGYRNSFLEGLIKVDRNEQFDKMKSNVEQII